MKWFLRKIDKFLKQKVGNFGAEIGNFGALNMYNMYNMYIGTGNTQIELDIPLTYFWYWKFNLNLFYFLSSHFVTYFLFEFLKSWNAWYKLVWSVVYETLYF